MSADLINSIIADPKLRERLERRFWSKVDCRGSRDCWPWKAKAKISLGYGAININYVVTGAHRVAFALGKGPIPEGATIRHSCDNPPCCNPDHLLSGTMADNVKDMMERGRHNPVVMTDEIRERIGQGVAKNRPKQTEEARISRSEAMRKRWRDPEWRERFSALVSGPNNANYGKTFSHTDEAKRKIGAASRGRKKSEETKRKMREAALARERRKREKRSEPGSH